MTIDRSKQASKPVGFFSPMPCKFALGDSRVHAHVDSDSYVPLNTTLPAVNPVFFVLLYADSDLIHFVIALPCLLRDGWYSRQMINGYRLLSMNRTSHVSMSTFEMRILSLFLS